MTHVRRPPAYPHYITVHSRGSGKYLAGTTLLRIIEVVLNCCYVKHSTLKRYDISGWGWGQMTRGRVCWQSVPVPTLTVPPSLVFRKQNTVLIWPQLKSAGHQQLKTLRNAGPALWSNNLSQLRSCWQTKRQRWRVHTEPSSGGVLIKI